MTLPLRCLKKTITVHCNGRFNLLRQSTSANWSWSLPPTSPSVVTSQIASVLVVVTPPCTTKSIPCSTSRISADVKPEMNMNQQQRNFLLNVSIRLLSSSSSSISPPLPPPTSNLQIQLYQYRICPFCNRVKTILDYINNTRISGSNDGTNTKKNDVVSGTTFLSVKHIEVNPLTKTEIKSFSKDYRKVPIATFDIVSSSIPSETTSKTIFGSDDIIHHLLTEYPIIRNQLEQHWAKKEQQQQQQQLLLPSTSPIMTYETFLNHDTAKLWTAYATNELAVWLYPNMCRSYRDSFTAFQYIHDPTLPYSTFQRYMIQYIGALAMTFAANKIKKRHNVKDERKALNDVLVKLEDELFRLNPKTSSDSKYVYLSGTTIPNIGDFNVYGVLRAIQNLPIYQEMILKRRIATETTEDESPIVQWVSHMSKQVSD